METIIKISNLSKRFNETVALDNCSFTIEKGEVFGYLDLLALAKRLQSNCSADSCTVIMVKLKYWANHPSMTQ